MKYLLCNKKSYTSGRMLSVLLGLKVTSSTEKIPAGLLSLRYGCSDFFKDSDNIFNTPKSIVTCANSLFFSTFCKENGIYSPEYVPAENINLNKLEFPVLVRNKYHHQGLDIIFVKTPEELEKLNLRGKFIVNFVRASDEIGVHVVNGKVVKIFKKVKINDNSHPFIKNIINGYHFKPVNIENNYRVAQELVLNAFEKIGLLFGRADVAFIPEERKYIIYEINTAPGLNKNTAQLYAAELLKIIGV